jgi:hypothetical protein
MKQKLPRSKTRDMEVSPVQGAATRSYETAPSKTIERFGSRKAGTAQKDRGTEGLVKVKYSKIPNK